MAEITFEGKAYLHGTRAIHDVDLEIEDGESVVLSSHDALGDVPITMPAREESFRGPS